jgi:acyl-CoA synthetase (AMP-forming)/AMP-acid ligase II
MHQTILGGADAHREVVAASSLRLIRSSSASLPPQVMKGLEEAFHAPVIEAYGMTEAAHQMASNPLPPRERKPGSVGPAAGPEVAIMDEAGSLLPAGQAGEIVIRGENVTLGYENNPAANQNAFTSGWFRTGDQGVMDQEGYLRITGRIKEMVNRGGEKVMPREVDEALLDHPNVALAIAFAAPHPTLGEDLAAAVVLRDRSVITTEKELREFAFSRLADFKVPSQIVIVDEIPKGPTGKLQRIGLAEKLAPTLAREYVAPTKVTEQTLSGRRSWAGNTSAYTTTSLRSAVIRSRQQR